MTNQQGFNTEREKDMVATLISLRVEIVFLRVGLFFLKKKTKPTYRTDVGVSNVRLLLDKHI